VLEAANRPRKMVILRRFERAPIQFHFHQQLAVPAHRGKTLALGRFSNTVPQLHTEACGKFFNGEADFRFSFKKARNRPHRVCGIPLSRKNLQALLRQSAVFRPALLILRFGKSWNFGILLES